MKFEFQKPQTEVFTDICEYIVETDLPIEATNFITSIKLSISKWGTSEFIFFCDTVNLSTKKTMLTLGKQKIAWTHKSYKEEFKKRLVEAMESIGGKKL